MKIRDGYELSQEQPEEIIWLVENLIPFGIAGDVFSMPDCGKSSIFLSLLAAIANKEKSWFGYKLMTGKTVYVGGEKSSDKVWVRDLKRATSGIKEKGSFTNLDPETALWTWKKDEWKTTPEYDEIVSYINVLKPVVTVLDTISRVALGNNPVDLTQQVLLAQKVEELQQTIGGTVLTISHTNQSSMNDVLSNRLHFLSRSGGNGYPGWLRWLMGMTNLSTTEKAKLGIDEYKKIVAVAVAKTNEIPQPMPRGNRFNPILFEITKTGELQMVDKDCEAVSMPGKRQNMKAKLTKPAARILHVEPEIFDSEPYEPPPIRPAVPMPDDGEYVLKQNPFNPHNLTFPIPGYREGEPDYEVTENPFR